MKFARQRTAIKRKRERERERKGKMPLNHRICLQRDNLEMYTILVDS